MGEGGFFLILFGGLDLDVVLGGALRVSGCVMDYCVGFGRCFGFCFVLWVWCCVGRCFVFGIVLWILVFVLGGALCIAGLELGGSVFCNFWCISF